MTKDRALPWSIFDGLPDPALILDQTRTIKAINQAGRTVFGERAEGRDVAVALRSPGVLSVVDAVIAGQEIDTEKMEVTLPGAGLRVFHVRVAAVAGDGDVIVTLHDITAEKRAHEMRADFVANVSHELRSPLASLLGFVETLQGPARDDADAREKFLSIMSQDAQRMTRLIDDLLSLSKVEGSEHIAPDGRIALAALIGSVADTLAPRAADREIALVVDVAENLPAVVGDGDELTQVFINLVDNALKYGNSGTEVRVHAQQALRVPGAVGPAVVVSITDQGDGISAADVPRLTERFYRVDKARSRMMGGTGLGLAIVKHILARHRGRLTIDSEQGKGSTFSVFLPTTG